MRTNNGYCGGKSNNNNKFNRSSHLSQNSDLDERLNNS